MLAYCFMPDHVHLLVEGLESGSNALSFIARAKQFSGFRHRMLFGNRLWQRYAFDRVVRSEEASVSVARYILENPVRAGLVDRMADYPFSGSGRYDLPEILEAVQLPVRWYRHRSGRSRTLRSESVIDGACSGESGPAEAGRAGPAQAGRY